MKTTTLVALGLVLLLSACQKEENLRSKLAGPKTISLYQWKKLQPNGSFTTIYNTTHLADLILWNNDSPVFNNVTYVGDVAPAGWYYANIGIGVLQRKPIGWFTDYEQNKTLTFWSEDDLSTRYRSTYAMDVKTNGDIHLETVYYTTDGVFFEVIELTEKR